MYQQYRDEISQLIRINSKRIPTYEQANITIQAHFKGARAIDTSNIDDKLIIDGLMHAGILTDDDPKNNPIVTKMSVPGSGVDKLMIIIDEPIKNNY